MILGIDASNIRSGGGLTHLKELLSHATPQDYGFSKVIVWSCRRTLEQLPDVHWLEKIHVSHLDGHLIKRILWQKFVLPRIAQKKCSLLFVPGGNFSSGKITYVTMSQNLLPFEVCESKRYGISLDRLRLFLLKKGQAISFCKSSGIIFLTDYAQSVVRGQVGHLSIPSSVISHGISKEFFREPKIQKQNSTYSFSQPFRWIYVSNVSLYKHQWHVVEAIARLRNEGFPFVLDLVGAPHSLALPKLKSALSKWDPNKEFVEFHGALPHQQISKLCHDSDGFVFASSCENLPIILLEGMASGLPIACSKLGPMPEVLRDGGLFFDPEDPSSIAEALRDLFLDPLLRTFLINRSFQYAKEYSWQRCAHETFIFLSKAANKF
ncbi:MAG: glycosyltransferase [Candidatus Moranbacteria bacterium]|nr:glycosyltransferase [Candidatus Moranbacteria bacterium]